MKFNLPGMEDRFERMAREMNLANENGDAVIERLFSLNQSLRIPLKLREAGVKAGHLDPLADLAIQDFAHPNNPKPVSRDDFRKLYQEAW